MRRLHILIMILLTLFVSRSLYAYIFTTYDFVFENIYYKIGDNYTVSVTYKGIDHFDYIKSDYSGSVVIPNYVIYNGMSYTVTSIDYLAFTGCSGLISVTIPSSVTSIGEGAFSGCSGLTSIRVEFGNRIYDSRNNCNAIINTNSNALLVGCKNTVIPQNVTSIGDDAFSGCDGLTSIIIPNSVTSIGSHAFYNCDGLTSIIIPNSVTFIGNYAFRDCTSLSSASISTRMNTIGDDMFSGCTSLTSITIPNSVTSIGHGSFDGCGGLTSITIPNSVTFIGNYAFRNCTSLSSASISTRMNTIGDDMFSGCSSLTSISIPSSVTKIGSSAFYKCSSLNSITISDNVTTIGENCFSRCSSLITLKLPNCLTSIDDGLFYECSNLASVSIPTSVTSIGDDVFMGCSNLKSISIPSGVKTIGKNAFSGCNFDYISIMSTVNPVNDSTFDNCKMSALVWAPNVVVPITAVNSSTGSNFLLYVKNASYLHPSASVRNVVINGTASAITLSDDGGEFYCPESFKAQKISYSHQYSMKTGGAGKGWETIALPFDVQKISHATRGEMTPFADYSKSSKKKPFWLYSFSGNGFVKSKSIQANTPYIIAMPNQSDYNSDYILSGEVTFSAENVTVPATPTFSGAFVPSFTPVTKSTSVSVLNVVNKYVNETGGYDAGSRFVSNLRDVRPFECYLKGISSTRNVYEMIGEDNNEE